MSNGKSTDTTQINTIKEAAFPVLAAPFNGSVICVKVRCLNSLQLKACGDFSIINISGDKSKGDTVTEEQLAELANYHEKILKETLVSPTYDEIVKHVYGHDHWINSKKKEIYRIKEKIEADKTMPMRYKSLLEKQINNLEMETGFLLPSDFTGFIVSWALGVDRSDIKKVTREMLLKAAILAKQGHDNPCDHLSGNFNDFHKDQVNSAAWSVYNEYQEEQKHIREAKKQKRGLVKASKFN